MNARLGAAARVLGVAIVAIVGLLTLGVGFSAVTTPGCGFCHRAEAKAVAAQTAGHRTISCVKCHVRNDVASRMSFGVDQVFGMVLRVKKFPDRSTAAVLDGTCRSCHPAEKGIQSARSLRINHNACASNAACTDCHAGTAHSSTISWKRTPDMTACLACHSAKGAPQGCGVCHQSRSLRVGRSNGSLWVVHSKDWRTTHAMGNMAACGACHQAGFCGRCHGAGVPHDTAFKTNHGAASLDPAARCTSCHQRDFCSTCHGIQMPHPANFTPSHSKIVKAEGDFLCKRCHTQSDCTNCHVLHVHPGGAVR